MNKKQEHFLYILFVNYVIQKTKFLFEGQVRKENIIYLDILHDLLSKLL